MSSGTFISGLDVMVIHDLFFVSTCIVNLQSLVHDLQGFMPEGEVEFEF